MNQYDVHSLAYVLHDIAQSELAFTMLKWTGLGSKKPEGVYLERANKTLEFADNFFTIHPIDECTKAVRAAQHQWARPLLDNSAACEIFHRLLGDIVLAFESEVFLRVPDGLGAFVDNEKLFGNEVYEAFCSARSDIKQAGNCLAADCNTAAVFHLMRAVEWGIRALAADLGVVEVPRKNATIRIEFAEWDKILDQLHPSAKAKVDSLPPGNQKQETQQFYFPLLQDIQGFKDAFRNHCMHTRSDFSAKAASDIHDYVKRFMVLLASKISE